MFQFNAKRNTATIPNIIFLLPYTMWRTVTRLPRSNDDEIEVSYRIVAQAVDYLSMFVQYMYLAMEIAVGLPPPEEMKVHHVSQ